MIRSMQSRLWTGADGHNVKPVLICPNGKHIYTVWVVPYRRADSDSREQLIGQKVGWEAEVRGDVILIINPFCRKSRFECLNPRNNCFGAQWLIYNRKTNTLILTPDGDFKLHENEKWLKTIIIEIKIQTPNCKQTAWLGETAWLPLD